jgi:hypothetical protein
MAFPVTSPDGRQTLMIALTPLDRQAQTGPFPKIPQNGVFWARTDQAAGLVAGNLASYAPEDTPRPPSQPPWTVAGQPGFAFGAGNASH